MEIYVKVELIGPKGQPVGTWELNGDTDAKAELAGDFEAALDDMDEAVAEWESR